MGYFPIKRMHDYKVLLYLPRVVGTFHLCILTLRDAWGLLTAHRVVRGRPEIRRSLCVLKIHLRGTGQTIDVQGYLQVRQVQLHGRYILCHTKLLYNPSSGQSLWFWGMKLNKTGLQAKIKIKFNKFSFFIDFWEKARQRNKNHKDSTMTKCILWFYQYFFQFSWNIWHHTSKTSFLPKIYGSTKLLIFLKWQNLILTKIN